MEMRDGMLGVVIIALAMVTAFAGAYLAGITSSTEEVVKYNYLADVNGLFETEQYPQYIEFDPSTNYTGYYSEDSKKPHEEGYFFAEDQVGFTAYTDGKGNPRANNYKLDVHPEDEYPEDGVPAVLNVSDLEDDVHDETSVIIYYHTNPTTKDSISHVYNSFGPVTYLSNVLDAIGIHKPGEYLLTSISDSSSADSIVDTTPFDSGWVIFSNKNDWTVEYTWDFPIIGPIGKFYQYVIANDEYNSVNDTTYYNPGIACRVVVNTAEQNSSGEYVYTGMAYVYADNNFAEQVRVIDIGSCIVAIGDGDTQDVDMKMSLSPTLKYFYQVLRTIYLDPNTGVWMKDAE